MLRENNEKMRQEFTANVSHELKTPLTSISGYAELIETGIAKPADTPGFASLEANRAGFIPKENLEHAFPEFGPYLGQCQFTGCSHRSEKGCAVRAALEEGKLSDTRYQSYLTMYEEASQLKEWER